MNKLLQIQGLDKSFAGVHAINHLSFDIYEGEILALIGPNGCGKSTCVNLISGVYIQDSISSFGSVTMTRAMSSHFLFSMGSLPERIWA